MGKMPMPRFTQTVSLATLISCSLVETSAGTKASTAVFRFNPFRHRDAGAKALELGVDKECEEWDFSSRRDDR